MATLNEFLEKALVNEGELVGDKVDEGKAYSQVASLIDTYHKKAEKMEIDLHKKIKSIVVKTDDKDELGKIAGAVGEVSEPGTYVSWKELEKSIGSIDEAVNKAFGDQLKRGGMDGGPGRYVAHFNMAMTINKANDMDDAMNKAQRIAD